MGTMMKPPGVEEWQALAPPHLATYRVSRYKAEDERRFLPDFAEEDRRLLRAIYATLLGLFLELKPSYANSHLSMEILQRFLENGQEAKLSAQVLEFGKATFETPNGDYCSRTIHDLRGGSFQALSMKLELFHAMPQGLKVIQNIYFLLRDHLKIMRNCVADLDLARFAGDEVKKDHATSLLVEKWSVTDFSSVRRPVEIVLECHYDGTLCESCLEFSTLDRIIYNLMNNAAHHTDDGVVHFGLFPVPVEKPENIRFVIANMISPEHQAVLEKAFPGDLTDLFEGGFSTGGHGLGTRICADFCAQAYGIDSFSKARDGGHFGAKIIGHFFVAWFHWPIVGH